MKTRTFILSVIVLLVNIFPAGLKAQHPNLVFNKLTVQEGLPENNIQCLIQDKLGYMWMGTQAGIVRYDGYQAKVYNFGKENALDAITLTLFEDQSGRIWAGTYFTGLLYYDRATDNFKPYEPASGNTISNNTIIQILDDGKNGLMIISVNPDTKVYSLDKINFSSGKIVHYSYAEKGSHHIDASILTDMIVSKNGKTWLATNNGFYNYDPEKDAFIGHFTTTDSTKQRRFSTLVEDPVQSGVLWMCQSSNTKLALIDQFHYYANEGVLQYNSNNNISKNYGHSDNNSSIGNDTIYEIKSDLQNRLWFATAYGLSLLDPAQNFTNYALPVRERTFGAFYITIQPDNKGNIWYGGRNGIEYFDTHTQHFINFGNRNQLPVKMNGAGYISQFLLDRNNTVWIATFFGGLYWINQKASSFTFIKKDTGKPAGYPGKAVNYFSKAKDNSIWMANSNGFYHWFPQADSFAILRLDPSINKLYGYSILLDSKGRIWCGTSGNGLYLHDPVTKRTVQYIFNNKDSNSISSNEVSAIYEDSKGRIWIGTWGGGLCLWRPESNKFKRYPYIVFVNTGNVPHNGELDDDEVHVIFEDRKGAIWVGTNNGAINRLDESTDRFISYYNRPPGFVSVQCALPTDSGNYYIGTYMDGLFLFDTKTNKAKKITKKEGLLDNGAYALLQDDDHNVWVASSRGFTIIDATTKRFRNIGCINGFPEIEISSHASIKTSDGKFVIGCHGGILVFNPVDFKPDTIAPLLHIEQLSFSNPLNKKMDGDSVVILYGKKEIRLSYDENKVSFFYTALSYQDAALNQYSVWLEGFEKHWVDAGTNRVATYNNLAPGTYTFHVKASNSDGVWTKTEETITIIISPPWWRTWWAYLLYIVALVLAIWAYNRYRMAGIKREKEVLENKVTDRTTRLRQSNEELKSIQAHLEMQSLRAQLNPHFMFNSLNAIQELILMEENDKSHSYLARFSKLLRLLLENTEKPFIPLQREIDFIQLYLSLENLRIPELQFSVTVDPAIDTEQTAIPNMILQPYIENAIWHGLSHKATDKKLQIRITKTKGAIQYEIEDNGVGRKKSAELKSLFRKEHKSKGMELLSKRFKLLSKELGADIVTSYEDVLNNGEVAGTLVTIKVPNNFSEEIKKTTP